MGCGEFCAQLALLFGSFPSRSPSSSCHLFVFAGAAGAAGAGCRGARVSSRSPQGVTVNTHTHAHTHAYTCVHTRTHAHTRTHTHTHVHTHMRTHAHACGCLALPARVYQSPNKDKDQEADWEQLSLIHEFCGSAQFNAWPKWKSSGMKFRKEAKPAISHVLTPYLKYEGFFSLGFATVAVVVAVRLCATTERRQTGVHPPQLNACILRAACCVLRVSVVQEDGGWRVSTAVCGVCDTFAPR